MRDIRQVRALNIRTGRRTLTVNWLSALIVSAGEYPAGHVAQQNSRVDGKRNRKDRDDR